jgi:hypothetical protein
MTIKVSKPEINIREKLSDLDFDKVPFQKMPSGSVLQVVESSTLTQASTTSSEVDTGIEATILPISASSKIVILITIMGMQKEGGTGSRMRFRLYRDSIELQSSDANMWTRTSTTFRHGGFSMNQSDTPNTSSETTYKVTLAGSDGTSFYINKDNNSGKSTMILMEIAQ